MAEIDFANQLFDAVEDSAEPANARELISPQIAVKVYTRHKRNCPKRSRSDWARCNCVKWLYVHRDGKDRRFSAQTRSWEKAERPAREIRDSFDPTPQLQRELKGKVHYCESAKVKMSLSAAITTY